MKYSNVVRFKVKEGQLDAVVDSFKNSQYKGLEQQIVLKTGDSSLCSIGVWESENHMIEARPEMIAFLDTIRDKLDVLSEELGVTDPVSGPVIFES
jgi:hypothetical protein